MTYYVGDPTKRTTHVMWSFGQPKTSVALEAVEAHGPGAPGAAPGGALVPEGAPLFAFWAF